VIGRSLPIYYPPAAGGESCGGPEADSDPQLLQEDGLQGGAEAGSTLVFRAVDPDPDPAF
jgi:hypothetical protein